ncbi:hypothetical protein F441_07911 [Phytophthora nicotianae CJ01A1]|uniref:Uncharacterized protein n=2 Tax=Phytophthora nicotianae TaxID=4792 RepID=W2GZW3_PHYNI|nr:hypothetical protein L915_07768 [Phytophthora nicotianae]ETL41279.1 hypothetical protein L916_07698 [Phytophthora nicotianae]ETP17731.1 hypothetical protein F441_07911 [Phytophthora nicotianae CJ01A1]
MQDGVPFMMSPMDSAGEACLAKARACIRKTFGPGGSGRRTKRALEMADEAPTPAKTPRTKVRQRIAKASQLNTENMFFQQFGSSEELMREEFDLARPAGHPVLKASRQYAAAGVANASTHTVQQTAGAPTSFFSFSSTTSTAFTSSLPAPSTANVNQLTRPTRIRTPRKAAVKRGRAGESSAEKALVLRKPRLGGVSATSIDYASGGNSTISNQTAAPSSLDTRASFAFVTNRGDSLSTRFFSRSPSKFQFSSNATRLFSQRQAPLR